MDITGVQITDKKNLYSKTRKLKIKKKLKDIFFSKNEDTNIIYLDKEKFSELKKNEFKREILDLLSKNDHDEIYSDINFVLKDSILVFEFTKPILTDSGKRNILRQKLLRKTNRKSKMMPNKKMMNKFKKDPEFKKQMAKLKQDTNYLNTLKTLLKSSNDLSL